MASKTMKKCWYCPCECKTPKGMARKFFKINTLFEHIISDHSDVIDTKFVYRFKNLSTNKKRSRDEVEEDGFKELLSVEEDEAFRQSDEDMTDMINATARMNL